MPSKPVQFLVAILALSLGACASRGEGPHWGRDATYAPGWHRLGQAALKAAKDPYTWAPAVGAAALQIGDADQEIAEWANRHTPVFGSRGTAADASDWLRGSSLAIYLGTGLAAPGGGEAWRAKAQGFAVGAVAVAATLGGTGLLKDVSDRTRPLGQNDASFPSGHASLAAAGARLSHETLRYYDLAPGTRFAADAGLTGLALMTGWARVEAGKHHPADVLAGAALGNFFAVFATEAFLHPAGEPPLVLGVSPYQDGWVLHLSLGY